MKRVFADTFFFLAVLNRKDPFHERALVLYGERHYRFVTTAWVLIEVADASSSSKLRSSFETLYRLLESDRKFVILPADQTAFLRGLDLYFARPAKDWSLTDCLSFIVMNDQGLTDALTGDRHFAQSGFNPLFL